MKYLKIIKNNENTGINYYPNLKVFKDGDLVNQTSGSGDYIRNGLVMMFDGLNKGATENAWTDLISQKVFNKSGSPTSNNDSWTMSSSKYLSNTDTLSFPAASCTIEVCYDLDTSTSGTIFSPMGNNNIALKIVNTSEVIWSTSSCNVYSTQTTQLSGIHTMSVNSSRAMIDLNHQLLQTASTNSVSPGTTNGIGGSSTNSNPFNGKIFAIRIYNRILSIEEMYHNQLEDTKRYNLMNISSIKEYFYVSVNQIVETTWSDEVTSVNNAQRFVCNLIGDYSYETINPKKFLLHWNGNTTIPANTFCAFMEDKISFHWITPFSFIPGNAYMFELSAGICDHPDVLSIKPWYFRQQDA